MDYSKYKESRNLSWKILIKHNITQLPIKVSSICKKEHINIISYEKADSIIKIYGLESNATNNDGFTFNNIIFYNQECTQQRQRFTVTHELCHALVDDKGLYNREPSPNDDPIEQAANVFASRLLAPACVLWGLNITTPQQIADLCNISIQSANFRFERLQELYKRENHFKRVYGKSCFLQSSLERMVYKQFIDYIKNNRL